VPRPFRRRVGRGRRATNATSSVTSRSPVSSLPPGRPSPDPVVENLGLLDDTGSAAVPLALDHAWRIGAVQPGSRVLLLAIETSKWIYAGTYLEWTAAAR
jgi:3-oxoacyl-[acyl-carrier-protein] synthase III